MLMGFPVPAPSWLLLAWAGGAATCAAALVGSLFGGRNATPWSLVPRPRSRASAALATLLVGVIAYPAIYGLVFETLGRADIKVGLAAGVLHAALAGIAGQPRRQPAPAARLAVNHFVYVVLLSFLYVTP
jgi:hypothetical protein